MADKKITQLNSLSSADALDVFPIVDISESETKKITVEDLMGTPGPIGGQTPSSGQFTTLQVFVGTTISNISNSSATDDSTSLLTAEAINDLIAAGTSGTSGTSGVAGTSGSSGTSGVAGTSGSSGTSGADGTSGSSGSSGSSGTSGAGDGAGGGSGLPLILPRLCSLDATDDDVSRGNAYNMIETINFGTTSDGAVWFTFDLTSTFDSTTDIDLTIAYNLNGNDNNKIVTIDVDYWAYGSDVTPTIGASDGTAQTNISTGTNEDGKRQKISIGSIPNEVLTAGETVTLKIARIATDTYTGTFQMFYINLTQ